MENNEDKLLKEKLQSTDFPFDPAAWQQMEAMLDKERKPKGLFWWWFGGAAACILLSAGGLGLYYMQTGNSSKQAIAQNSIAASLNKEANNQNTSSPAPTTVSANNNMAANQPTNKTSNASTQQSYLNNTAQPTAHPSSTIQAITGQEHAQHENNRAITAKSANTNHITKAHAGSTQRAATSMPADNNVTASSTTSPTHLFTSKHKNHNAALITNDEQVMVSKLQPATGKQGANSDLPGEKTSTAKIANEPVTMELMKPGLLYETIADNEADFKKEKTDDVNLKKLNKKIVTYSMGVMAGISGTTMGWQAGVNLSNSFDRLPTYAIGFTHDLMFIKRIAITNGLLFSQTSFTIYNPDFYSPGLLSKYSSHLNELDIPIGLKGYVVSKPKFRYYIASGIINHMKLKETFDYTYRNSNITAQALPTANWFNNNSNTDPFVGFTGTYSSSGQEAITDVSLNKGKRFYISYYASTGAEFILQKHFVLFSEAAFYMSLQKAGIQQNHKYNLGLNAGFRYQF